MKEEFFAQSWEELKEKNKERESEGVGLEKEKEETDRIREYLRQERSRVVDQINNKKDFFERGIERSMVRLDDFLIEIVPEEVLRLWNKTKEAEAKKEQLTWLSDKMNQYVEKYLKDQSLVGQAARELLSVIGHELAIRDREAKEKAQREAA